MLGIDDLLTRRPLGVGAGGRGRTAAARCTGELIRRPAGAKEETLWQDRKTTAVTTRKSLPLDMIESLGRCILFIGTPPLEPSMAASGFRSAARSLEQNLERAEQEDRRLPSEGERRIHDVSA